MAYVANYNEDEQKQSAPVAPVAGGAVHLAPSSGVGSGPTTPGTTAPQNAGGQFASLDKYVTANQGQAQPLANRVSGSIGDQYNLLNQGNQSVLSNLTGQVSSAYTPNNPDVIAQESANPISFAGDTKNVQAFQSLLNDKYTGPASAESTNDFQAQQAKVNNAIAKGQTQTQTDAGRQQLISGVTAKPTAGVTALNSAILSKDPNALSTVQDAYKPFSNLVSGLSTGASDVNTKIAKAQADVQAANQAAQGALSNQTQGLNAGVQKNLDAATTANQNTVNLYNGLVDTLSHGANHLSADQLNALGLTPEQGDELANQGFLANTSQYMTGHNFGAASDTQDINNNAYLAQFAKPADPNANQVATPEQFNLLKALFALNNGQTPTGALIDPTQSALAGTYTAPSLKGTFDYNAADANAQAIQRQERADAQAKADAMTAAADEAHNASKSHTFGGNLLKDLSLGGKYLANPLLVVPQSVKTAKNLASKI